MMSDIFPVNMSNDVRVKEKFLFCLCGFRVAGTNMFDMHNFNAKDRKSVV